MPDYPWELDGWEKRLEATGWPPWETEGDDKALAPCRLAPNLGSAQHMFRFSKKTRQGNKWFFDEYMDDFPAACLIREHWRVLIIKHGAWPRFCLAFQALHNYDDAQAVTVDAVLREKGDSDE